MVLKLLVYGIFLPATLTPTVSLGSSEEMGQNPAPSKPGLRQPDACRSHTATRYLGAEATPSVRNAITLTTRNDHIRWIKPGTPVTQDFRADRLNIILDYTGRIMTMRCG